MIRNTSIHAGIRAPVVRPKGDVRNDVRCGFEIVRARDIDRLGVSGVIDTLKKRVAGTKVYISVDIDVLDPAYAPATGTAEVGGWTTRELLSILDGLEGLEVVGADVGKFDDLELSVASANVQQQLKSHQSTIMRVRRQCWLRQKSFFRCLR